MAPINSEQQKRQVITVVGGGLVGSLAACVFAKLGYSVRLYERREDIRTAQHVRGRSINMALSTRGRAALTAVGLESAVTANAIPMYARMIHNLDGSTRAIPYGTAGQCIMSIDRRRLNEILLSEAEKSPNVQICFSHKLVGGDIKKSELRFEANNESMVVKCDVIVGCDGAYSGVRRLLDKAVELNYQQQYIGHGYVELHIPANEDGTAKMPMNYLHIWPREEFMLIALPNPDNSFTVTLFMPLNKYQGISNNDDLLAFFNKYFPDAIPLMGADELCKLYFSTTHSSLVSIKCAPYNYKGTALILGDAAHAMVPFFGQGMNCGFEDCTILEGILSKHNLNTSEAFEEYSATRHIDAVAICDLAMYNYLEMRSHVNSYSFLLRKKADNMLHAVLGQWWVPLYTMVSFSRLRYSECARRRRQQDALVHGALCSALLGAALGIYAWSLSPAGTVAASTCGSVSASTLAAPLANGLNAAVRYAHASTASLRRFVGL